jgi:hypothetical protein
LSYPERSSVSSKPLIEIVTVASAGSLKVRAYNVGPEKKQKAQEFGELFIEVGEKKYVTAHLAQVGLEQK